MYFLLYPVFPFFRRNINSGVAEISCYFFYKHFYYLIIYRFTNKYMIVTITYLKKNIYNEVVNPFKSFILETKLYYK